MVDDLGINHPNADDFYVDVYRHRSTATLRHTEKMDPAAFDAVRPEYEATVALGEAHRAELMTFDSKLADAYRRVAGRGGSLVAPEMANIAAVSTPRNYNNGRQLLGLRALNVSPDGSIHPLPTPPKPKTGNGGGNTGGGGAQGDGTLTSRTGEKIEPVEEHGPSVSGDAKFQGATLAFRGANYLLQKINTAVQARRLDEKWKTMQSDVQQRLDADPQLGALLLVYYSKGPSDPDSEIDTVTIFEDIRVGYGLTPGDALRNFQAQDQIVSGKGDVGDTIRLKPKEPLDIKRFKFPVGTTAAGLATFVPGKEKLVRVKFEGSAGFDDKLSSRESLDVPAGMTPRFYFLWPPNEISYFNGGTKTVDVGWTYSHDADISQADIDYTLGYQGVPVVSLDPLINPSTWTGPGAVAAMIWPSDNRTANLFQGTAQTQDNNGLLIGQGYEMVRWVRPEFMRVIKYPVD